MSENGTRPSSRGIRLPDLRSQIPRVEARGIDSRVFDDVYYLLLSRPWWQFFAIVTVVFLSLNTLFAAAYLAVPSSIVGARDGSFEDAFFFSVQTLATIGYGTMSPASLYAHCVVTLEALTGMFSVALMTGITFAKFARPTARVLFSERVVIGRVNGVPHVMFRMANWRGNMIVEAQLRVIALVEERTDEGDVYRRPNELQLVRDRNATFFLSWTAMHRIDEKSPFYGTDPLAALRAKRGQLMLSLSGVDDTMGQMIHARRIYELDDIHIDRRFADVISTREDGTRVVDYSRFHDVELTKDAEAEEKRRREREQERAREPEPDPVRTVSPVTAVSPVADVSPVIPVSSPSPETQEWPT